MIKCLSVSAASRYGSTFSFLGIECCKRVSRTDNALGINLTRPTKLHELAASAVENNTARDTTSRVERNQPHLTGQRRDIKHRRRLWRLLRRLRRSLWTCHQPFYDLYRPWRRSIDNPLRRGSQFPTGQRGWCHVGSRMCHVTHVCPNWMVYRSLPIRVNSKDVKDS